jgi:hypothetical protein
MSISAISGSPAIVAPQTASVARAPDGDVIKPGAPTNDHDRDESAAATSPTAKSSSAVQAALTALKTGG